MKSEENNYWNTFPKTLVADRLKDYEKQVINIVIICNSAVFHRRGDKDLLQVAKGDHALVKSKFP